MENQLTLPQLDTALLQEKANEFAMKGAIESLKEFYSGYNSPYRKAIDEQLKTKGFGHGLEVPDIVGVLNDSLSKEIDELVNTTIAQTYLPLVKKFLVREKSEMLFSEFLKAIIEHTDTKNEDDCSIEIEKSTYGWLSVKISAKEKSYSITLHEDYDTRNRPIKKYQFLSLPDKSLSKQYMELITEGSTLKIPFTSDVLRDRFVSFIARLVIAQTKITMDCYDFEEEMFTTECHC